MIITTADSRRLLNCLAKSRIVMYDIKIINELTIRICVKQGAVSRVTNICKNSGDDVRIVSASGTAFIMRRMFRRPLLLIGLLVWFILIFYIPGRIFFVEVEGNEKIPTQLILEKAENSGISFGQKRRDIRSERIKNTLLAEIPDLKWVGINTFGCRAVISVSERSSSLLNEETHSVGHIVATNDGVISKLTVTKGTPLCLVGQAVTEGQILVSGYTDCGFVLRAEKANAEVLAITQRRLTAIIPARTRIRTQIRHENTDYSIQIGKNIIKLSNSTGIQDNSCVKMYKKTFLTLPGNFRLPLALIRETVTYYDNADVAANDEAAVHTLLAEAYLLDQMLMGQIKSSTYRRLTLDDVYVLEGRYICEEMIGKQHKEEIGR